jgi:hypothetical protein
MGQSKRRREEIARLKAKGPKLKPGETQRQREDICGDCGSVHFGYMILAYIWNNARLIPSDACCCGCLENKAPATIGVRGL